MVCPFRICVNLDQIPIELLSKLCCTFTSFMVQCFTSHSYSSIWRQFPQSRLDALKTAQIPVLIPVLFPVVIPVVIPQSGSDYYLPNIVR
jgi:hypothetical protein